MLPRRVPGYRPERLDQLCASGEVVWVGAGLERVALFYREDAPALGRPAALPPPEGEAAERLRAALARGGALLVRPRRASGLEAEVALPALWELVWAGEVTNDAWQPLRARRRYAAPRPRSRAPRAGGSRASAATRSTATQGRWSLAGRLFPGEPDPRALAELLLERQGIVTRDGVRGEGVPGGYAPVYRELRKLETLGVCRRGYFVEGLGGAQFALPGAVERLREKPAEDEAPARPRRRRSGPAVRRGARLAEAGGRTRVARRRRLRRAARRRARALRRARRPVARPAARAGGGLAPRGARRRSSSTRGPGTEAARGRALRRRARSSRATCSRCSKGAGFRVGPAARCCESVDPYVASGSRSGFGAATRRVEVRGRVDSMVTGDDLSRRDHADGPRSRTVVMRAADWDRRWAERLVDGIREPNRFLVDATATLAPGRALDLACGAGRNAVWLAEHGWRVTGVDFSPVALAAARGLAAEHDVALELVEADVVQWMPPPGAFDLVCVMYLQLPAAERRAVLQRAGSALAPGGTLLVVAHDASNLDEGYAGPSNPAVLFTAEDVVADLPALEIEQAERVCRPVETDEGERTAIDALVRARRPLA